MNSVTGTNRRFELERLLEIDRPRPWQLVRDRRRDDARAQHAVRDASLEARGLRELLVDVHSVVVARGAGEQHNVRLGDRLGERCHHADRQILDIMAVQDIHVVGSRRALV